MISSELSPPFRTSISPVRRWLAVICTVWFSWAALAISPPERTTKIATGVAPGDLPQTEWDQLLPDAERANFRLEAPRPIHNYLGEGAAAASQSGSLQVNKKLNGMLLKVPGFIVPLNMTGIGEFTEFFLVPYVGACIHVPPPPPNQIVYVKLKESMAIENMWVPYYVIGKMSTDAKESRLGLAAYSMTASKVELFR